MPEYQSPVFYLNDKEHLVKALGIQLDCVPGEIKILVNGVDIVKSLIIDSVVITIEKKPAAEQPQASPTQT